jgi:hypothetical protein
MKERGSSWAAIAGVAGLLFVLAQVVFWIGSATGIVREYCLDVPASRATNSVQVESSWTYVMWPPLIFSSADPPGRCVRNTPLHEGLSAIGIWKLPSPEQQVREHVAEQLH